MLWKSRRCVVKVTSVCPKKSHFLSHLSGFGSKWWMYLNVHKQLYWISLSFPGTISSNMELHVLYLDCLVFVWNLGGFQVVKTEGTELDFRLRDFVSASHELAYGGWVTSADQWCFHLQAFPEFFFGQQLVRQHVCVTELGVEHPFLITWLDRPGKSNE